MPEKKRIQVRTVRTKDGIEFAYTKVPIAAIERIKDKAEGLGYPRNLYLAAYDAFKCAILEYNQYLDSLPAGIILAIGLNVLEFSGFFTSPEETQTILEDKRQITSTYFQHIRNMACFHFGYKFEESKEWTFDQIMEMAARLEAALGIELNVVNKEHRTHMAEGGGSEFTVRKGDDIPERVINAHNVEAASFDSPFKRDERAALNRTYNK